MRCPLITFFILLAAFHFPVEGRSQHENATEIPDKPLRIEIPARSSSETYRTIPCGPDGLILFFRSQEVVDALHVNWYFSFYDTNMQQVWVKSIPLLNEQDLIFTQPGTDTLGLFFVASGKSRSADHEFELLRIVIRNGTFILNKGMLPANAEVVSFAIRQDRAWLGINIKGQAGTIRNIRLKQGLEKSFSLGQGNLISVCWMKPDSTSETVTAVVGRQISKRDHEYYLVRYDTTGIIKTEILIGALTGGRELKQMDMISSQPGEYLLLGIYGDGTGTTSSKNRSAGESTGFFACSIKNNTQKSIQFYNYLELQHANSLLGERDIMNLKKKALKKNKSLGEYSLDVPVLLQGISRFKEQYIIAAEIFSPQYHSENFTDFDYYGRPYTNSYSVFDGYRFANAIVAGFNLEGKLIWDNTLEIINIISHELTSKVVLFQSGDDHVLCYISDGKIGSKIITENRVVEKLDFAAIDLMYPGDKLISESRGRLVPWYANYFLSSGYHEIKNISLESNNKRLVFYFSKLRFEK